MSTGARLVLYHNPVSPHSRGALWVIRYLGLDVEVKIIDLASREQLRPEFCAVNPQHCLPTLVDGDFTMWEARAIGAYLVNSRQPGSALYPTDPRRRAVIDQRLYFDVATLYKRARDAFHPISYDGETTIPIARKRAVWEAIEWLELFLQGEKYVAGGEQPSLADIYLMSSMLSLVCVGYEFKDFPNISAWLERNKSMKGYEECLVGARIWGNRNLRTLKDTLEYLK